MRGKGLIASAVLIGVALAGILVWALRPSPQKPPAAFVNEELSPRPERKPTALEARLQTMAVASCNCERRHPTEAGKDACWKEFRAKIRPLQYGDEGLMMCEPSMHFYELTTGATIVTGYYGP